LAQLEEKLKDKSAVAGIVGIGYVGLPLAAARLALPDDMGLREREKQ
jgi:UDP-N-acetyl-D-mannosaminuronate dehydrogenase